MTTSGGKLEAVPSHAVAAHAAHASSPEEGLEYAVRVHIVETVASTILQVLTAVVHSPLFLITKDCICFANLKRHKYYYIVFLRIILLTNLLKFSFMVLLLFIRG